MKQRRKRSVLIEDHAERDSEENLAWYLRLSTCKLVFQCLAVLLVIGMTLVFSLFMSVSKGECILITTAGKPHQSLVLGRGTHLVGFLGPDQRLQRFSASTSSSADAGRRRGKKLNTNRTTAPQPQRMRPLGDFFVPVSGNMSMKDGVFRPLSGHIHLFSKCPAELYDVAVASQHRGGALNASSSSFSNSNVMSSPLLSSLSQSSSNSTSTATGVPAAGSVFREVFGDYVASTMSRRATKFPGPFWVPSSENLRLPEVSYQLIRSLRISIFYVFLAHDHEHDRVQVLLIRIPYLPHCTIINHHGVTGLLFFLLGHLPPVSLSLSLSLSPPPRLPNANKNPKSV